KTCVLDAASLGVQRRIERGDVVFAIRFLHQLAHTPMSEAENRIEVTAFDHLPFRYQLVAVLSSKYVRPQQAFDRMICGQAITRRDRQRRAGSQMDPIEMAH